MEKQKYKIKKIISGGQSGADRGALNAAIHLGIPHGGYCPKGRKAEDGPIPKHYQLTETSSTNYAIRTVENILQSDGTLLFTRGQPTGGSLLTKEIAEKKNKPFLQIDLFVANTPNEAFKLIHPWLEKEQIAILNIAGTRASKDPKIEKNVFSILLRLFK